MTGKPLKPCNKIGCRNLTQEKYCEEHKQASSENQKYYDRHQRDKKSNSFYKSWSWRKARGIVIARDNGLCQQCLKEERIVPGVIVDHITPLKQDWSKRLALDNLWLLCQSCHNKKTGRERAGN